MKKLRAGFVAAFVLIALASIGTLYVVLNKLGGSNNEPSQVQAAPNCSVINGCVADHPERRCNDQGQKCTFYIGEPGYEISGSCIPGTGTNCNPGFYCMKSGSCYACIKYETCFWKDEDNCVADESCGGPHPTPTHTQAPTPTATPSSTPSSTPTPTATPTNPPGEPNFCNGTCGSNSNCQGGYFCYNGFCRNPSCSDKSDCNCTIPISTPTPPPVLGATAPPVLPKTGGGIGDLLALFGIGGLGSYLVRRYRLI